MANHRSAIKRAKQSENHRLRNKGVRTFYRNKVKSCKQAIEDGNAEEARTSLKQAVSAIDRAVSKRVIHHNTGRRYISRLTRQVNRLNQPSSSSTT